MKGIIIYSGKYGATRQYADWLSKEINMPVCSPDEIGGSQLACCEVLIPGSSVKIENLRPFINKFQRAGTAVT